MSNNPSALVRDWMIKFQREVDQEFNLKDVYLCGSLIQEEFKEVTSELYPPESFLVYDTPLSITKDELTKELCDLIWVCYFCAHKFGLPIEEAFKRVYDSNMSKLQNDGTPLLREDGKILKGPDYKEADLKDLF